jgi:probable F420-dependent oxidoreductase
MTSAQNRPVRIGVQVAPQHASYEKLRDVAGQVEEAGADILFNWDHFYPLSGDPDGLHFESWTMLAALAEQTTRIEFGALVNCNSYRNANLQADMARTVDHISAKGGTGRFIFGTGSGWFQRDYDEYGYEFGTVGGRLNALADALPVIEDRWTKLNPAPTRDIPVLIGGGGEKKTLRIVAKHADIWHSFSDAATLEHKLGVLAGWCSEQGRDMAEIEVSVEINRRPMSAGGGVPSDPFAAADELRAIGASLFTVGIGADTDLSVVRDWIAWRDAANG